MKRKTLTIIVFSIILSHLSYAQNQEFIIQGNLNDGGATSFIEVFKINKVIIDAPITVKVDGDNPEYLKKQAVIDSLNVLHTELAAKVRVSDQDNKSLQSAISLMNSYLRSSSPETSKFNILENAQKELDKTNYKIDFYRSRKEFYAACDGRLIDAASGKNSYKIEKYLQKTMNEINDLIRIGNSNKSRFNALTTELSKLERELINVPRTAKINQNKGFVKREISLVDTINTFQNISGRFTKKEGPVDMHGQSRYAIMLKDYKHFVKNELILKDSVEIHTKATRDLFKGVGGNTSYLIENVETKALYYTTGDIFNKVAITSDMALIYNNIAALNITMTEKENKTILNYKGFSCVLTPDLYERLSKKDATVIEEMHKSIEKRRALMEKATISADKLRKHISAYKSRTITTEGLNEWKKETKLCNDILAQMRSLPFANTYYYSQQFDREETTLSIAIMEYVSYSEEKLGL